MPGTTPGTKGRLKGVGTKRGTKQVGAGYGYGVGVYEGSVNLELTVTAGEGGAVRASAQERRTREGVRRVARWARTGLARVEWRGVPDRGVRTCERRTGVLRATCE